MVYKDYVITHNKGTDCEVKEVITNISFSVGDLIELKKLLQYHAGNEWRRLLLQDVSESLLKIGISD
jgi:hypothetical protein